MVSKSKAVVVELFKFSSHKYSMANIALVNEANYTEENDGYILTIQFKKMNFMGIVGEVKGLTTLSGDGSAKILSSSVIDDKICEYKLFLTRQVHKISVKFEISAMSSNAKADLVIRWANAG